MDSRFDVVLLSQDKTFQKRLENLSSEFSFQLEILQDFKENLAASFNDPVSARIVIADSCVCTNKTKTLEFSQIAKKMFPGAFIIVGVQGSLRAEEAALLKQSGCGLIFLESELHGTSKLEFALTQLLDSQYLPVKVADLLPEVPLPFELYHLMPLHKKFVKIVGRGTKLEKSKIEKFKQTGELYIDKTQSAEFSHYVETLVDASSNEGVARRCRAKFMELFSGFSRLVFLLTDQGEQGSFKEGEALIAKCNSLCKELLSVLETHGDAWDIVTNSAIGKLGSVERGPAVAAYAGIMALEIKEKPEDIMLAGLLCDLGVLLLPPELSLKVRQRKAGEFSADEKKQFENYPMRSVDIILGRKISLSPSMRMMIQSIHERADGNGFPNGIDSQKLPKESQLVGLCKKLDSLSMLQMGLQRKPARVVLSEIIKEGLHVGGEYSPEVLYKLKTLL